MGPLPLELMESIAVQSGSLFLSCVVQSRYALIQILESHSDQRDLTIDARSLIWMLGRPEVKCEHIDWSPLVKQISEWPTFVQDFVIHHDKVDWGLAQILELGFQRKFWNVPKIESHIVESDFSTSADRLNFIRKVAPHFQLQFLNNATDSRPAITG